MRRHIGIGVIALALACGAHAQEYPGKPIRMIIPAAPGGGNDALGRVMAEGITKQLGQPVVIEHKAGASGQIAGEFMASAPNDGYTLMMTYAGLVNVNPAVFKAMKYDPVRDFTAIAAF